MEQIAFSEHERILNEAYDFCEKKIKSIREEEYIKTQVELAKLEDQTPKRIRDLNAHLKKEIMELNDLIQDRDDLIELYREELKKKTEEFEQERNQLEADIAD